MFFFQTRQACKPSLTAAEDASFQPFRSVDALVLCWLPHHKSNSNGRLTRSLHRDTTANHIWELMYHSLYALSMAVLKPPHTLTRSSKRGTIADVSKPRIVHAGLLYLWDSKRALYSCPSNFNSTAIDFGHASAWVPNDDSGFKPVRNPRLGLCRCLCLLATNKVLTIDSP
jgi:hypothetical protein